MIRKLTLLSEEGTKLEVEESVASKSEVLKALLENSEVQDDVQTPIKFYTLTQVMEYCKIHENDTPDEIEKPIQSNIMQDLVNAHQVSKQDAQFINMEKLIDIIEIINAASYLDIKSLLDLSSVKIAMIMKGKSPEEIRKIFNIQNDLTEEQKTQALQNNEWEDQEEVDD